MLALCAASPLRRRRVRLCLEPLEIRTLPTTGLLTASWDGFSTGNDGPDISPALSADGRFVAFTSSASNFVQTDTNGALDVFVRDLTTGVTSLVSCNASGTDSGNGYSIGQAMSADGRYVAFSSVATDLGADNPSGFEQIFIRDLVAGTTTLVSLNSAGDVANDNCGIAALSADGHVVAFTSSATNLDPRAIDPDHTNLYVRDLVAGTTTLVSVSNTGDDIGDEFALDVNLSADGHMVTFVTGASTLDPHDTNGILDIYARDLVTGTTQLVTVNKDGNAPADDTLDYSSLWSRHSLSADGRYMVFSTSASDLVAGQSDGWNVFVRDLVAQTTSVVNVTAAGTMSQSGIAYAPSISADGRFVAFASDSPDIVNVPTDWAQIYVRDLQTGTTSLVSANDVDGGPGDMNSLNPLLSSDGRFVLFESVARDLTPGTPAGDNSFFYLRDLSAGTTTRLDVSLPGGRTQAGMEPAELSAGGEMALFSTFAPLLGINDRNAATDLLYAPLQTSQLQFRLSNYHTVQHADHATVTIDRVGNTQGSATIHLTTADGTAHAFQDYSPVDATLTFADGETSKDVAVPILANVTAAADTILNLVLSDPVGNVALGGPATATLTIHLGTGAPPRNLINASAVFTHSLEHYRNVVAAVYQDHLSRAADDAGLAYWAQRMANGLPVESLEAGILASPEYATVHGATANATWVSLLYSDVLNRSADAGGAAFWSRLLAAGASRYAVAYFGFTRGPERESMRIRGFYQTYLLRAAGDPEVNFWVNVYLRGWRNEDILTFFIGSAEYYQQPYKGRFNASDWIMSAYEDVLNREPTPADVAYWLSVLQ